MSENKAKPRSSWALGGDHIFQRNLGGLSRRAVARMGLGLVAGGAAIALDTVSPNLTFWALTHGPDLPDHLRAEAMSPHPELRAHAERLVGRADDLDRKVAALRGKAFNNVKNRAGGINYVVNEVTVTVSASGTLYVRYPDGAALQMGAGYTDTTFNAEFRRVAASPDRDRSLPSFDEGTYVTIARDGSRVNTDILSRGPVRNESTDAQVAFAKADQILDFTEAVVDGTVLWGVPYLAGGDYQG